MTAVRAFQKKLELCKRDIENQLCNLPRLLEQGKDETDTNLFSLFRK